MTDHPKAAGLSDEQVLAEPEAYTIEQVAAVFERSSAESVAAAKAVEARGQNRKGIAEWEPAPPPPPPEPKYNKAGWRERARSEFKVSPHAIAGALHDVDAHAEIAAAEVRKRLAAFAKIGEPGEQGEETDG